MTDHFSILYSTQKIDFRSLDKSVEDPRYEGIRAVDRKKVGFHVSLKVTKSHSALDDPTVSGDSSGLLSKAGQERIYRLMQHYVLIAPFVG